MTPEELAEAVLKAAGSSLRHYTLHKTREEILRAARNGILEEREACAALAEGLKINIYNHERCAVDGHWIADAIRSRP